MTEVERIINEGILPKSFLDEEIRCDFVVDKVRKKIWAIELDLLIKFDKVCKNNNLRYYLIGGSLLGAIRHKGFIPWDDDIDVGMPREDYKKLLKLSNAFVEPYFLQTPHTDPEYAYSYAKLRNSRTTCVPLMFRYQMFNHGIFLDIFPYDNWLEDTNSLYIFEKIKSLGYENSTYMRLTNPHLDELNKKRVENWCHRNHIEVYEEIQALASSYASVKTEKMIKAVFAGRYEQEVYYTEDLVTTIDVDFEGFHFPIPKGYDRMLKIFFGDYMTFPPIDSRNGGHDGALFEPDVPYDVFIANFNRE